jgi:hypothetical protein
MNTEMATAIIEKQQQIIDNLTQLLHLVLSLLSQYMAVEEYEYKLRKITEGNDAIV